jgi:hypothetical protein
MKMLGINFLKKLVLNAIKIAIILLSTFLLIFLNIISSVGTSALGQLHKENSILHEILTIIGGSLSALLIGTLLYFLFTRGVFRSTWLSLFSYIPLISFWLYVIISNDLKQKSGMSPVGSRIIIISTLIYIISLFFVLIKNRQIK